MGSGDGAADRVREVVPDGVDLVVDLVGGQSLQDIVAVAKDPKRVISTADPDLVAELGGAAVVRTDEALAKITDVIEYGLVTPNVGRRFSLADAPGALAAVKDGHTAGKLMVVP